MEPDVEAVESEPATIRTWCVVYDVETNDIVHTHEHLALDPDGRPSKKNLARAAIAAIPSDLDRTRLAVAHPQSDIELRPNLDYALDPDSAAVTARPAKVRTLRPR